MTNTVFEGKIKRTQGSDEELNNYTLYSFHVNLSLKAEHSKRDKRNRISLPISVYNI